jgi:group I intron endonuclease
MIVYKITNEVNGHKYIGITSKTLLKRMKKHISDVKQGRKYKLHNSIRKYGAENFTIKQIDEAKSAEELREKEIKMIAELKPELNISPGGSLNFQGHAHTEEHKQYMSKLLSGKNNPAYGKPGHWLGKEMPKDARLNMSIASKNKPKKHCVKCNEDFDILNYNKWHGDNCGNTPKQNCVHCNRDFDPLNYKRWHGEKCKSKGGY